MGQGYLIDSNVIIDYTGARLPEKGNIFVEKLFDTDFLISVATKIEVLGYRELPEKMDRIEEFVNSATIFPLNDSVTDLTILLRRKHKKLKLGDAIIAATAAVYNLILVSRNTKDFNKINSLKIVNPHELQ